MRYQTQHARLKRFSIFSFLFLTIILASCGDQGKDAEPSETTTTADSAEKEKGSQASDALLGNGRFVEMALRRDDLDAYFSAAGGNALRLVFRFGHDGGVNSSVKIQGFLTRNNIAYEQPPIELIVGNDNVNLSGQQIYLSDLELTRTQYRRLRDGAGDNRYLSFFPFVMSAATTDDPRLYHCVNYGLSWVENIEAAFVPPAKFATDNQLNPSPPADPRP